MNYKQLASEIVQRVHRSKDLKPVLSKAVAKMIKAERKREDVVWRKSKLSTMHADEIEYGGPQIPERRP